MSRETPVRDVARHNSPVAGPCASYAAEEGLEGIYGATTTPERRAAAREVA